MHTFFAVLSLVLLSTLSFASPALLEIKAACVCENGKALNIPSCRSFCSDPQVPGRFLHLSVFPSNETLLDRNFGATAGRFVDILNFCAIPRTPSHNPSCQLIATNENGAMERISFALPQAGSSHLKINISSLKANTRYQIFIQEITSALKSSEWTLSFRDF